ncbi:hypothetical protein cand_004430 [Cryptosporidium andersoni]|uniref:Transmembrane protein n=1 Tax=Cryptosporidium andersoni TaxID=117008 RepID=A0A1J4MLE8_9CRYT|nr:hypothetical protein cand_004430 [Cryptosporidium andersoni]
MAKVLLLRIFSIALWTLKQINCYYALKNTLNCKYPLLPEFINGIGLGTEHLYISEVRGIYHKPENQIHLEIYEPSIVTISLEKSYESTLDLSYLNILHQLNDKPGDVILFGNHTWGSAGNNTRLLLRGLLQPSSYIISIGSNYIKDEYISGKVDTEFCSPIRFDLALVKEEDISYSKCMVINPFKELIVHLDESVPYKFSNEVDHPFLLKTPESSHLYNKLYKGRILWSKLFFVPINKAKPDDMVHIAVELGFRYIFSPLQLILEPIGSNVNMNELLKKDIGIEEKVLSRVLFGSPVYNGQVFRETIALRSFRLIIIVPEMSHIPTCISFDLNIQIKIQPPIYNLMNTALLSFNQCNLKRIPSSLIQDGIELFANSQIPKVQLGSYMFGSVIQIKGSFAPPHSTSLSTINIRLSKPSTFYMLAYHDHSEISVVLSKSTSFSQKEIDEFYGEEDNSEVDDTRHSQSENIICKSTNLAREGITIKETPYIYCQVKSAGDYYLHIYNFLLNDSKNSVLSCSPLHLHIEVIPLVTQRYSCPMKNSIENFSLRINKESSQVHMNNVYIYLGKSSDSTYFKDRDIILLYSKDFEVLEGEEDFYFTTTLTIPEHAYIMIFMNLLYKGELWSVLNPVYRRTFHNSIGPLLPGKYTIQLFASIPLDELNPYFKSNLSNFKEKDRIKADCISFTYNIRLVRISEVNTSTLISMNSTEDAKQVWHSKMCEINHMTLPSIIDLRILSPEEDYILDGTYLIPLDEYELEDENNDIMNSNEFWFQDLTSLAKITIYLSTRSVLNAAIENYHGIIHLYTKSINLNESKKGYNNLFIELNEGVHNLFLQFDLLEDFIDETIEEGGCPQFKFHLSISSLKLLPIFPALLSKSSNFKSSFSNLNKKWTQKEITNIANKYIEQILPTNKISLDLTKLIPRSSNNYIFSIDNGNGVELNELNFWFSPLMNLTFPITTKSDKSSLTVELFLIPNWIPLVANLIKIRNQTQSYNNGNFHLKSATNIKPLHYNQHSVELLDSNIERGSYILSIHARGTYSVEAINRCSLIKIRIILSSTTESKQFSLRQELLNIPDLLPSLTLPDSLNRLSFLPNKDTNIVTTILINLKEKKQTFIYVPKGQLILIRCIFEPSFIAIYEVFVSIYQTSTEDHNVEKPIFESSKYGDTLTVLNHGNYTIQFQSNPNDLPYLITIGLTYFDPLGFSKFFEKFRTPSLHKSEGSVQEHDHSIDSEEIKKKPIKLSDNKFHCHYFIGNLMREINPEKEIYYNSGKINVCQGPSKGKFVNSFTDMSLNVQTSSIVYLEINSNFLYHFYRIGIIVPEGYWVAEQRGMQSYLEVELGKGNYIVRIESLNSYSEFEDPNIIQFTLSININPMQDSFTVNSSMSNRSDVSFKYECYIPNSVPLPLDLSSIQGGSTVYGGPIDPTNPNYLLRARVILTDIHNGRKKVYFELARRYLPIFVRISVHPVNFDISDTPNLLQIFLMNMKMTPFSPISSFVDQEFNSIDYIFNVDNESILQSQLESQNLPYWLTFTHSIESSTHRPSCIAFDLVIHIMKMNNKFNQSYFKDYMQPTKSIESWRDHIQTRIDKALKVRDFPQYIHISSGPIMVQIAETIDEEIFIDLSEISLLEAFLIINIYYNPLLVLAKLAIFPENDQNISNSNIIPIHSSVFHFTGNISTPLYGKQTISMVVSKQFYSLELSLTNLPPFMLKSVPIKFDISLVSMQHKEGMKPLIISVNPDLSVPILSGQNLQVTIRLSIPLLEKKNSSELLKCFYIIGKTSIESNSEVTYPSNIQILDSGFGVSITFNSWEITKTLVNNNNKHTLTGYIVINNKKLIPKAIHLEYYTFAPWIYSEHLDNQNLYLPISAYKSNSVGWATLPWNGKWDLINFERFEVNKLSEIKRALFGESSGNIIKQPEISTAHIDNITSESIDNFSINQHIHILNVFKVFIIIFIITILCYIIYFMTNIKYWFTTLSKFLTSSFINPNRRGDYDLVSEKNDFDFLDTNDSEDENPSKRYGTSKKKI